MAGATIIVRELSDTSSSLAVRELGSFSRLWRISFVRKFVVVLTLAVLWEVYGIQLDNPLLFPTLHETLEAFASHVADGTLPAKTVISLKTLLTGYSIGLFLAAAMTITAMYAQIGSDFLDTSTGMFSPLPAIALLPLAMVWFGLGTGSLVFVLVHSVLWPVALNMHSGFKGVSKTLRMVGQNYGLKGFRFIAKILVPAGFPSILTGLKIGWAFAWRTLIAAELVFGASSGKGGLGWFVFEHRNTLEIPSVFAGLVTVILIGLFVENAVFRQLEQRTVVRWGLQT